MKTCSEDRRLHDGLTYDAYLAAWKAKLEQPLKGLAAEQRRYHYFARYNYERSQRVHEAFAPSAALREAVQAAATPPCWMVLTEDWCSDSAFTLPVLVEAARLNPGITLRILHRDEHLDLMDRYLTRGSRSIPKLVAFDEAGEERFVWGPRTEGARRLREERFAAGATKDEVTQALLAWYEHGGWREVEDELIAALHAASSAA